MGFFGFLAFWLVVRVICSSFAAPDTVVDMVTHNLHVRFALLACLLACLVGWLLKKLIGLVCWEGKRTKVQGMSRICRRCGRYITVFAKKKKKKKKVCR